jgi:hypothetical protein
MDKIPEGPCHTYKDLTLLMCPRKNCDLNESQNSCYDKVEPAKCNTLSGTKAGECPEDRCDVVNLECVLKRLPECFTFENDITQCPAPRCVAELSSKACYPDTTAKPQASLPGVSVTDKELKLFEWMNMLRADPTVFNDRLRELIKESDPDGLTPATLIVGGRPTLEGLKNVKATLDYLTH